MKLKLVTLIFDSIFIKQCRCTTGRPSKKEKGYNDEEEKIGKITAFKL